MNWRQIMLCIGTMAITGCAVPPGAPQPASPAPIATPTLAQPTNTPRPTIPPPTATLVQPPNSPLPTPPVTSTFLGTGPGAGPKTSEAAIDAFLQWQYSDAQGCKLAVIGARQMRFGACGEPLSTASSETPMWPTVDGQSQASYIKQAYAPFTADTVHGTLVFSGTGTAVASKAEQRAIAEWAFTRFEEASFGYISADFGLKLFWQEKSASLCGTLWIYQTGLAVAWNCAGNEALGVGFLSGGQLQQFYAWLGSGVRWDVTRDGQAEGKPSHLTLQFPSSNSGSTATDAETEAVLQFAHDTYVELSAHKSQ